MSTPEFKPGDKALLEAKIIRVIANYYVDIEYVGIYNTTYNATVRVDQLVHRLGKRAAGEVVGPAELREPAVGDPIGVFGRVIRAVSNDEVATESGAGFLICNRADIEWNPDLALWEIKA